MDVSIIIINYNTWQLTKNCIESIYLHTEQHLFEVIVIDNASTDGSYETLSTLEFDNYSYIYNKKNIGFSRANNKASLNATGRFLFFMNSDMVFVNDVIFHLVETLQNNSATGIAGPNFQNPDGSLQISCRNFPNILFGLSKFIPFLKYFLSGQVLAYYQKERDYSIEQNVDTVSAGAFMISRKLFEDMGRFDEFSFMYAEDADICRRVRDIGLKVTYNPAAVLIHFGGQSSRLNSYKAIWSYYFAFYYLYKKYYFGRFAMLLKPAFFLRASIAVIGNYFKKDKRITWNNK
ncbi:glycosyltransferase family 2 protein [Desulfobacula sp.]|uniref:glycosyltransferase family 2 protein n=1 Tax=Desulfobacula sp. TaxID=2593537 RepID=UPI0025C39F60|nr:glycosyltransferase family 2 protein [Desulfobacula sp.]MBC2704928.1 glycosyltransferase family 2 protein [Desulfobacula sp.]